jgi:hypothetical protein
MCFGGGGEILVFADRIAQKFNLAGSKKGTSGCSRQYGGFSFC